MGERTLKEVEVMAKRPPITLPSKAALPDTAIPDMRDSGKPPKRNVVKATLYLAPAVHEELRKLSFQQRRSQQTLLYEALDQWLERQCGKNIREIIGDQQ
jgi:hypothetical protein